MNATTTQAQTDPSRAGALGSSSRMRPADRRRNLSRGQALVVFTLSIFVLTGMVALVIDVTWYWANTLKVQRAADAAALAGVIYLPGNATLGISTARTEATKNGYTDGTSGASCQNSALNTVHVTPTQDASNTRRMDVTLSAPVPTFFMRIFGIDCIQATRTAKAEFVLPVPMGSPLNYYGDFGTVRRLQSDGHGGYTILSSTPVKGPHNETLTAQGFWAEMLSQGAESISGDAYLPYWDTAGSTTNSQYNPQNYYDYAVDMPAGATSGRVYIFDPGFCETDGMSGTGDDWYTSTTNPVSAFYMLYNTNSTPYDLSDDTLVASSGNTFYRESGSDTNLGGSSGHPACDAYHNTWYQLAGGLSGGTNGTTYRLRTTTTDPNSGSDQRSTNARNGFAIFGDASGGTPYVHGLGAMEMFTPLPGGQSSTFYLAQIDAINAGKTMQIMLWDPGDTNQNANIQVLQPTTGGYTAATFSYSAKVGTTNSAASSCNSDSGTGATQLVTYDSGGSNFNGCWVTITVPLPTNYSAPTPPGESSGGWWKIRYNMSGASSTISTDITTWQVNILGNPVHLIVPY